MNRNDTVFTQVPFPKIIHQTWKNKDIPEKWKESSTQWQALHPGWRYHYTTDEDNRSFVQQEFPQYLDTYDKLPYPIQRADMIRYMYLYHMGGVYSDLDIVPLRSLSEYTFDQSVSIWACSSGNTPSTLTNSFMISQPKCKVWLDLLHHIKTYKKWFFTIRHVEIMNSTGPGGFTKILKGKSQVGVLPSRLFMRFSSAETETLDCKKVALEEGVFNYPLVGNSWHSWDSALLHHAVRHQQTIIIVFIILLVFLLLYLFYRNQ